MVKKKSEWDYTNRFPHFGSPEHNKACGGNRVRYTSAANTTSKETAPREENSTKCSVLVRPDPNGTEGLALWASNVVMGYFIHGQIAGGACKFYIDYGPGVDVEAALISQPSPTATVWSIPPKKGFDCRIDDNCHYIWTEPSGSAYRYNYRPFLRQQQLAAVPFYRFAYNPRYDKLNVADFRDLGKSLMGKNGKSDGEFNVHTGFACAFSSLFQLSPEAVRYEPNLFTHLLPTLQDPTALVIGIYIRTGATEGKASAAAGYEAVDNAEAHIAASKEILNCAQEQEIHFGKGKEDDESGGIVRRKPKPQRIVWMLVTDSRHLKEYVSKEYGGVDVVVRNDKRVGDTAGDGDAPTSTIPRVVLTTSSTGAHTRPKGAVTEFDGGIDAQRTEGFASAVIDWWLLGESDVSHFKMALKGLLPLFSLSLSLSVSLSPSPLTFTLRFSFHIYLHIYYKLTISSRDYTFGNTAAMRTARAVYQRVLERNDGGSLVNNACGLGRIT